MIAVSHGEQKAAILSVFFPHAGGIRKGFKRRRDGRRVRHAPAAHMAAAHVEFKVVYLLQSPALRVKAFQNPLVRIVRQQHDVGKFDGRVLPDHQTGRNAGSDRPLRRADQRLCARRVVVALQIHGGDQPQPAGPAGRGALQ